MLLSWSAWFYVGYSGKSIRNCSILYRGNINLYIYLSTRKNIKIEDVFKEDIQIVYYLQGLATKGWMLYYASSLTILGPSDNTPLRSFLSKCVDVDEYGKVFTLSSVIKSIAELMTSALSQKIYVWTVDFFPGAMYLYSAATETVSTTLLVILFWFVSRHEKVHGPIGEHQDKNKWNSIRKRLQNPQPKN